MRTVTIAIPDELSAELASYEDSLGDLLRIGLREVKMEQSIALFRKGDMSIWKAARLAGVSLREMTEFAAARGLRAEVAEEDVREELA